MMQRATGGEAALLRGVATTSWMLVKRWQLRDWRVHGLGSILTRVVMMRVMILLEIYHLDERPLKYQHCRH